MGGELAAGAAGLPRADFDTSFGLEVGWGLGFGVPRDDQHAFARGALGRDAIVCDTGGTTFDVGLVRDGELVYTRWT